MAVLDTRFLTTLALAGSVGLAACDELDNQAPTGPSAEPGDVSLQKGPRRGLIAFVSTRDGFNTEIYTMSPRGGRQTRLTNNTDRELTPAWSPDRSKIAFVSVPDGGVDGNIFVMNADGTGRTQLTTHPSFEENPDWSPDGSKIAFNRDGSIVVMNADGSGQTELPHESNDNDWNPDWSPDGSKIVFLRDRGFTQVPDIWVMNPDGSGAVRLTDNTWEEASPSWSPDGTRIAFSSERETPGHQVYVMNADGSGQTQLTSGSHNSAPAWSPNGKLIAFQSHASGNVDIWGMRSDGTGARQLTTDPGSDFTPAWAR